MSGKPVKIYNLFPAIGGFSNKTIDYRGEELGIAAVSVKQAHYFAHSRTWLDSPAQPRGIVWRYLRSAGQPGDHYLWCGCRIFGGLGLGHMAGERAIHEALARHECDKAATT